MKNTYASFYLDLFRLGWESSFVITLRLTMFAAGGAKALNEAQLMVTEKHHAAVAVAFKAAIALASGHSPQMVGRNAVAHYHRKVVANRRRLLRRR